jgi:hypothetical protein
MLNTSSLIGRLSDIRITALRLRRLEPTYGYGSWPKISDSGGKRTPDAFKFAIPRPAQFSVGALE